MYIDLLELQPTFLDDLRVFGRRDDEWTDGVNDECLSKKNDWRAGHRQDDPETNVTGRAGVCRPKPGRPASFPNYFISKKAAEHGAGVVILLEGKVRAVQNASEKNAGLMRRRLQHLKRSSEERNKIRSAAKTKPPHDWKFGMRRYARDLAPHEACIRRAMHENPPAVNFTYRRFCRVFRDVFQAAVPGLPPAWPTDPPLSRSRHPHGHNLSPFHSAPRALPSTSRTVSSNYVERLLFPSESAQRILIGLPCSACSAGSR
jgi:hypothetical protein